MELPPLTDEQTSRLASLMERIPDDRHDDAIQVAWLAHCEGADPVKAVDAWRKREVRFYKKHQFRRDL